MSAESSSATPASAPVALNPMSMTWIITKREFLGYFRTPVAYVFLAAFLAALVGLTWFMGRIFDAREANLLRFFSFVPWLFLILIPAVGMRLWAEERRSGTWELMFTYPVSVTQAVIAKFLAGWAFVTVAIALTFPLPLTIEYLGEPDWGPIWTGYLGAILMAGAYLGICSLMSSLTKNQVIAFILGLLVCMLLVLLGFSPFNDFLRGLGLPNGVVDGIANFSFVTHFEALSKGLVMLRDLGFFAGLIVFSLLINILVLER